MEVLVVALVAVNLLVQVHQAKDITVALDTLAVIL